MILKFKMLLGETIKEVRNHLQKIINKLARLGKIYDTEDIARKLLWSLS